MFLLRWRWHDGSDWDQEDFVVERHSTLYDHLHEHFSKQTIDAREHLFFLARFQTFLHLPFSQWPDAELAEPGVLALQFPTPLETSIDPENEDKEGLEIPSEEVNAETDNEMVEANPSEKQKSLEPLHHVEQPKEAKPSEDRVDPNRSRSKQPRKFTFADEEVVPEFPHIYRQTMHCQNTRKRWVAVIGSHVPLETDKTSQPSTQPRPPTNLCFLIDTSGSMIKWIVGVREKCHQLAEGIVEATEEEPNFMLTGYGIGELKRHTLAPGAQVSVSLRYNVVHWPLMPIDEFKKTIDKFKLGNAGRRGCFFAEKGTHWVLETVLNQLDKNARNIVLHISDEYDESEQNEDLKKICDLLTLRPDVTLLTLGRSFIGHTQPTTISGGRFWDIKTSGDSEVEEILNEVVDEIRTMLQFDANKASEGAYVTQCDSTPFFGEPSNAHSPDGSTRFGTEQPSVTFQGILNMQCHHCSSTLYGRCGYCNELTCLIPDQTELECPHCANTMVIRKSSRVESSSLQSSFKKGK